MWVTIPICLLIILVFVKTGHVQVGEEPDLFWLLDGGALFGLLIGYLIDRRRGI